jgi:hypothetical protein
VQGLLLSKDPLGQASGAGSPSKCGAMSSGGPSDQSNAAWDDADAGNGGGFVSFRHDDPDRAGLRRSRRHGSRARFGDDAVGRMERSRALGRHPRPLTDEESAVLRAAVGPLLRDIEATGQARPDIREEAHDDRGEDAVCAWIRDPGNRGAGGQGVTMLPCCSPGDRRPSRFLTGN